MKSKFLFALFIALMLSCSNDDDSAVDVSNLQGSWLLIEQLADPGDGSGTFREIESNKTLEFKADGTVITNQSLCEPYTDEQISQGTYSFSNNRISTNCQGENISSISFSLEDGFLRLDFISNEGFSQKFVKINN